MVIPTDVDLVSSPNMPSLGKLKRGTVGAEGLYNSQDWLSLVSLSGTLYLDKNCVED